MKRIIIIFVSILIPFHYSTAEQAIGNGSHLLENLGIDLNLDREPIIQRMVDIDCEGCNLERAITPLGSSTEYSIVGEMRDLLNQTKQELMNDLQAAWTSYSESVRHLNDKNSELCSSASYAGFVRDWNILVLNIHVERLKIELIQNELQRHALDDYELGPTNEQKKQASIDEIDKIREVKLRSLALIAQKTIQTESDSTAYKAALSGYLYTTKAFDRIVDLNEPVQRFDRIDRIEPFNMNFRFKKMMIDPTMDRGILEEMQERLRERVRPYGEQIFSGNDGNGAGFRTRLDDAQGHKQATPEQIQYVRIAFLEYLEREFDSLEESIFENLIVPLIPRIRHPHDIMHLYKTLLAEKEYAKTTLGIAQSWSQEVCEEKVRSIVQLRNMRISNRVDRLANDLRIDNQNANEFLEQIIGDADQPITSVNRSTYINLAPQFYGINFQGKTNACVGFALAANIDSHDTIDQSSPSYTYAIARAGAVPTEDGHGHAYENPFHEWLSGLIANHLAENGVIIDENGMTENITRANQVVSQFTYTSNMLSEIEEDFGIRRYLHGLNLGSDRLPEVASRMRTEQGDDVGLFPYEALFVLSRTQLPSIEEFPVSSSPDVSPDFNQWAHQMNSYNQSGANLRNVTARDWVNFFNNGNSNKNMVIKALSTGHPLFVSVNTDIRDSLEDWYYMLYSNPELTGHAINISGYQIAINPWTLEPEDVFIVRDSLNPLKVSQKVPASHLMNWTQQVTRVTEIKTVPKGIEPLQKGRRIRSIFKRSGSSYPGETMQSGESLPPETSETGVDGGEVN